VAVLFTADAYAGLADGTITLTFRRWTRPQAKAGGTYRVGDTTIVVDDVREVRVRDITDAEARLTGEPDRAAVVKRLGARTRGGRYNAPKPSAPIDDDTVVWRVEFHRVVDPEPKLSDQAQLTDEDVAEITRRLDRLDAASSHGAWTRTTLRLIADNPGVVSTTLAESVGRERQAFKVDVRKLKRLGLTESLEVGYRLSPRGRAYLAPEVP
jgi:hypothetical protein